MRTRSAAAVAAQLLSILALGLAACGNPVLGTDAGDAVADSADARRDVVDALDAPDVVDVPDATDVADASDVVDAMDVTDVADGGDAMDVADGADADTGMDSGMDAGDAEMDVADASDAGDAGDATDASDATDVNPDACIGTMCGTACVDVSSDPLHCGSCATDCTLLTGVDPSAVVCTNGACVVTTCAVGRADCNNDPTDGCEVDLSNNATCGSCTTACAEPSPLCTAAGGDAGGFACASGCTGTTSTRCAASCVDVTSNPLHCGGCDMACPVRANANATCASSICGFTCLPNFADCNNDPSDGCEANLLTGAGTCGTCTDACSTQNIAPTCAAGQCTGVCNTGFGNCDNDLRTNGCEHDLRGDVMNCGACGNVCPGADNECQTRTCTAGVCGFSFAAAGTAVATQTAGDCQQRVCDGAGGTVSQPDNTDIASDGNQCTTDTCVAGVPAHPPVSSGTACTQNGGTVCDGLGACVSCLTAASCPGSDTACHVRTCTLGTCGVANTPAGTTTSNPTAGDCHTNQCDGNGNEISAIDNTDVPADDGNQCTSETCTAGVPSHPNQPTGSTCNQNGGSTCDGNGNCVSCMNASQCPGSDNECSVRTCTAGVCGRSNTAAGTVTSAQTAGDCHVNQCDGNGNIVPVIDDTDVGSDNNQCTGDVCTAGVLSHPNLPVASTCSQNGGTFCDGAGSCVQCLTAATCPGTDTECRMRSCNAGVCGFDNAPDGTALAVQTSGDCQQAVCDGSGSPTSRANNSDVPVDGNACTSDVCTAGVPSNPPAAMGTACMQNGGSVCDGSGACVQCLGANDCPSTGNECATATCTAGACGTAFVALGTPTTTQTAGDCQQRQCDGLGTAISTPLNSDVPDDNNQCTNDLCTLGIPSHTNVTAGTACTQNGGTMCDGSGTCVASAMFTVTATSPADGATGVNPTTTIAVTFSAAATTSSVTAQTTAGACTGSVQVSLDNFATCIAFASATPAFSSGNTIATFTPQPGLLVNRTYKIRVTGAQSATSMTVVPFTQTTGFTTAMPYTCGTGNALVISQIFGGGGNSGAPYTNDFVVIHNRSDAAVSVAGMSIQYASAAGTSWAVTPLTGSIPAGGYYLVREGGNAAANGAALPTTDVTGTIDMSASNGKVALVNATAALSGSCPTTAVDLVSFGTGNCGTAAPAGSNTASVIRQYGGCANSGNNAVDFVAAAPAPRNTSSTPFVCTCANNESNAASEVNFCNIQFPTSLSLTAGMSSGNVYTQVYQAGVTEAAGDSGMVRAQLGYGPTTANPQYTPGWIWTNATYNTQQGNNDEYQASFTAPAAGSYNYGYRVSIDSGATWTYCDLDGAGSNPGLDFRLSQLAPMTTN